MPIRSNMPQGRSRPSPDFVEPELTLLTKHAPEGDAWRHEIKIDGYRTGAQIERSQVAMFTRAGNDWTARFRPIAVIPTLNVRSAYLDGEKPSSPPRASQTSAE